MSIEEKGETSHVQGPPWKIVGRFSTFDEADQKRLELGEEENLQVKIHWQMGPRKSQSRYYTVKTRTDPSLALEEALNAKRAEKKRRKARLSKKRRRK